MRPNPGPAIGDYLKYEDEEDPIPQKSTPYWRLVEFLNGQRGDDYISHLLGEKGGTNAIVGLYNKNTTDRTQKDVKIREQTEK